jgi:hypothetical protein
MKPQSESKNIVAVRRLYEAHGNPDIVKTVLAPEVRWEVVEGFPHSGVYHGMNACSAILKIGTPSQRRFLKPATMSSAWAFIQRARKRPAGLSRHACARLDAARRRHRSSSTVRGHGAAREGIGARPQQMRHEQLRSSHRCDRRQPWHRF